MLVMLAGVHQSTLLPAPHKPVCVYAWRVCPRMRRYFCTMQRCQCLLHHHQCIRVGLDYASGREAEDHWKPVTKLDQAVRLASKPSTGKTQYDCSV